MIKLTAFFLMTLFCSSLGLASPVNINTASAADIAAALNGIGIVKAKALVAYRQTNGMFNHAEHIIHVKGIGKATYEKNKDDILVK